MKVEKIHFKNFKSFYNDITIDFKEFNGLWKVAGQIGSGKTTIGEAIIFGLFGTVQGKNNRDLISWGQKNGLVELWCISKGKHIYIKRDMKYQGQSPLYVEVNGEPIVFTNKRDAQSQLEQDYYDATKTTMELLCVISFNNFKSLSTMNTKETRLFLNNVLGFDRLDTYIDLCKQELTQNRTQLMKLETLSESTQNQLSRLENINIIEGDLGQIRSQIDIYKKNIDMVLGKAGEKIKPLQKELSPLKTQITEIITLGKIKKKEIDFIKKGICPTCGQPIDQSQLPIKLKEQSILRDQYKQINTRISDLEAHIQEISTKMNNYISEQKNALKSKENEFIKLKTQEERKTQDEQMILDLKNDLKKYENDITNLSTKISQYELLIDTLNSQIRSKIINSFIPALNTKIKEICSILYLSYVPSYDNMFKCMIQTGTNQQISINSLSTGQLKMVDMAIILAFLNSIVAKVNCNIIFLDELFSNLDNDTRSNLIRVLRSTLPQETDIFIVSHQDLDTELFDGTIKISLNSKQNIKESKMTIIKSNNYGK